MGIPTLLLDDVLVIAWVISSYLYTLLFVVSFGSLARRALSMLAPFEGWNTIHVPQPPI